MAAAQFLAAGCLAEVRERKDRNISTQDRKLFAVINKLIDYGFYRDFTFFNIFNVEYIQADNQNVIEIRTLAVTTIVATWKDNSDTLPWLKQRAQTDDDSDVRRAAVQELARNFKDEAGILELFCNVAVNDPFQRKDYFETNPRQSALEVILKHYPKHTQTLPLLRDREINDPDEKLREWVKKKLQQLS